jgi:WD40 repeat protein
VSGSSDKTLRIWDAESGQSLCTLSGHENSVLGCAWSPDGCLVASTSDDGTLRLWDPETGCEIDRRIYLRRTPEGPVWATVNHRENRIVACHPEAWRILGWRDTGPGPMPVILPAETFGPLPVDLTN